jgi:hypothetical protein
MYVCMYVCMYVYMYYVTTVLQQFIALNTILHEQRMKKVILVKC